MLSTTPKAPEEYITVTKPGRLLCEYSSDGSKVRTVGEDGTVRIVDPTTSQVVALNSSEKHLDSVYALAKSQTHFVTAGADGKVLLYNNENVVEKILVRSVVPVRDVSFHPSGNKLIIAADEADLKIVLTADNSKVVSLKGHKHPVKSVSYHPKGNYIASTSCDGNVSIWDVGDDVPAPTCVKTLKNVDITTLKDFDSPARIRWNPDGKSFACSGANSDIRVFAKGLWTLLYSLSSMHVSHVDAFEWSPNGYYLASACRDNQIVIWDTKNKEAVALDIMSHPITDFSWHPTENILAFTTVNGDIYFWNDVIPNESKYPHPALLMNPKKEASKETPQTTSPTNILRKKNHKSLLDAAEVDDATEEDVEMEEDLDDFVIDDDGAGYAETWEEKRQRLEKQTLQSRSKVHQPMVDLEPPNAFQPGETPFHPPDESNTFEPEDGERRYLANNLVGAIYTIYKETHSIVNVEFHDQTERRNFHFTDLNHFSMASVSDKGAIFAVEGDKTGSIQDLEKISLNESKPEHRRSELSILHYRPFNNSGLFKEWTMFLPSGEDVVNVAINSFTSIVATSKGYIRVFTLTGVQKHIFSLDNVISMVGKLDLALIVYATGPSFTNQQNLKYMLLNSELNEVLQKDDLPISKNNEITWVGFTETTQAVVYDSDSVIRVLQNQRRPNQGLWTPVFDGKLHAQSNNKEERYWPVGVVSGGLICYVLRGSNLYPFFPRPIPVTLPLRIPTLQYNTESGQAEEEFLRINVKHDHERDEADAAFEGDKFEEEFQKDQMDMDKILLKMIHVACKHENWAKALDITYILHSPYSIEAAAKIAYFFEQSKLAERMMTVSEEKFTKGNPKYKVISLAEAKQKTSFLYESTVDAMSSDLAFTRPLGSEPTSYKRSHLNPDTPEPKRMKPFAFSRTE
ncbi:WD40-repeat-containing domain protein [Pilobolus umbonatus]|nr:WD40-repeat-containing domain protein [Pilobolus umbonatus]